MQPHTPPVRSSKAMTWTGWILGVLAALGLLLSASMKLMKLPAAVEGFAHFGYPPRVILALGVVELTCAVVYLIPRTAVLGAILMTGYLGGATATHVRVGEPYYMPILLGVVAWLGIYLRDARVRALVPLRKPTA